MFNDSQTRQGIVHQPGSGSQQFLPFYSLNSNMIFSSDFPLQPSYVLRTWSRKNLSRSTLATNSLEGAFFFAFFDLAVQSRWMTWLTSA